MKPRVPIYAKILGWFFLNVALLAAILYVAFQLQSGSELIFSGQANQRLESLRRLLIGDLARSSEAEWDNILSRYAEAYPVKFLLFNERGDQVAGPKISLPPEVAERVEFRARGFGRDVPPPPGRPRERAEFRPQRREGPPEGRNRFDGPLPQAQFFLKTSNPTLYWIGARLPNPRPQPGPPFTLLLQSESIRMGGLTIDLTLWIWVAAGALVLSALFWAPFAFSLTRSVARMTAATARIAEGKLETRVSDARGDELGELARAINQMAERLAGFVTGQKRFLGDIAHELCSPLARIQMAVGILEQRPGVDAELIADLREEAQEMSALVNELLSFSKASLDQSAPKLERVNLLSAVEKAVKREEAARALIHVPPTLHALGSGDLLVRAIANILRNAIRHGSSGAIEIQASRQPGRVSLRVRDHGPGVPESDLPKLFDPFYRVDTSRTRETGGAGLGLAIVKTCVEACGGSVTCRNARPGLEVEMLLLPAEKEPA